MISQKWLLVELTMNGKTFSEEDLATRSTGTQNVLEFTEGGKCYIKSPQKEILLPNGKTRTEGSKVLQRNTWYFENNENEVVIISEENEKQRFFIQELKSKKMTLFQKDGEIVNIFTYEVIKE